MVQQNGESSELMISSTVNQATATDAFFDSDTCWTTGNTNIEYWEAGLPDESLCSIYSVQYELANTYEIYVEAKLFDGGWLGITVGSMIYAIKNLKLIYLLLVFSLRIF